MYKIKDITPEIFGNYKKFPAMVPLAGIFNEMKENKTLRSRDVKYCNDFIYKNLFCI